MVGIHTLLCTSCSTSNSSQSKIIPIGPSIVTAGYTSKDFKVTNDNIDDFLNSERLTSEYSE